MDNYKKIFESYVDFSMDAACLRDVVYKGLKQAIVEGQIPTGSRIVEKRFADQMNISRTPVREALKRLETEGFIEHVPNVGAVVKCMDKSEIVSLYKAKFALESVVLPDISEAISKETIETLSAYLDQVEQAAEAGDLTCAREAYLSFQNSLLSLAQNKMIFGLIRSLEKNYGRVKSTFEFGIEDYKTILETSRQLVDSLITGNIEFAQEINYNRHMAICDCILKRLQVC